MKNLSFLIIVLFLFSSCAKESLESFEPTLNELETTEQAYALKQQQTNASSFQLDIPSVGDKLHVHTFANATGGNSFSYLTISKVSCVKNNLFITAASSTKNITVKVTKNIMKKIDVKDCYTGVTTNFTTYIFTAKYTSSNNNYYEGSYDTNPNYGCALSGIYDPTNSNGTGYTTPKLVGSETSNSNIMYLNWL